MSVLLLSGCSYINSTTPLSSVELTEKCQKSSQKYFIDYTKTMSDYNKNNYQYTNHYNQRLSKCFINIVNNESGSYSKFIYDVYENNEIAGLEMLGSDVLICWVQENKCKSEDEYTNYIKSLMEQ